MICFHCKVCFYFSGLSIHFGIAMQAHQDSCTVPIIHIMLILCTNIKVKNAGVLEQNLHSIY